MQVDEELIRAVLAGETGRYAELVSRYQAAAWQLAYGFVGNWEDARDISQNAFVKAYRHLDRFRGRARFFTWFYRIILNECKDFCKGRDRRRVVQDPPERHEQDAVIFEVADPGQGPREAAASAELGTRLTEAIRELPQREREAFLLHHVQGLKLEEVAQVMGRRTGTVKAHIFKATRALQRLLEPYWQEERRYA